MQQAKRILLIGIGRWGANHLRILQSMPIELFAAESDSDRLNSSVCRNSGGSAQDKERADPGQKFAPLSLV
jgi:hypothetical protein